MSTENDPFQKIIKYVGIAAVSFGVNHIIKSLMSKSTTSYSNKKIKSFKEIPSIAMAD